jgi:3-phenylpropionate/trans-cinnamate dioxygenase ferredoxin component
MAEYVAIAPVEQLKEGTMQSFEVGGTEIAVARCEGEIYAFSNICTHALAYLSEGDLDTDDCTVECPLHGARFDITTGQVRSLPATTPLPVYAVEIIDGQIHVAIDG